MTRHILLTSILGMITGCGHELVVGRLHPVIIRHIVRDERPQPPVEDPCEDPCEEMPTPTEHEHGTVIPVRETTTPIVDPGIERMENAFNETIRKIHENIGKIDATLAEMRAVDEEFRARQAAQADEPRKGLADQSGIWFDEAAIQASMPSRGWRAPPPAPARRVQWLVLTIPGCVPCTAFKDDCVAWLQKTGWIVDDTEAAHVRIVDVDQRPEYQNRYAVNGVMPCPKFVLLVDGRVLLQHDLFTLRPADFDGKPTDGLFDRFRLVSEFQRAIDSLPHLMKSHEVATSFSAGTIPIERDKFDMLLKVIGHDGPFELPNDIIIIEKQGVKCTIQAGSKGVVSITGNVRRVVFDPEKKPAAKWGWISATADSFSLDESAMTLTADMGLPANPSMKIEITD